VRRVATYRFQLTPAFGFEHVVAQLDRLRQLGVSHAYLSPVTEAVPGSSHGYDVVDHTRVRDELGGLDGLTALLDAAASRGMGVVIDHVANHVAVGRPELNRPWWAMLRDGPASEAARWFDVDWESADGKVILPVLGAPLADVAGSLVIVDGELRLGTQRFPLADGTADLAPGEALERQHYRLQHWQQPERNVRRFFTIDDLVAVRVEDPDVAAAVDTVPRLLSAHDGFAGVRVDHVDGLADPLTYLEGLRRLIGSDRWLLVEKILAPGERLPDAWPVDGTTGYEHAAVLEHALLDADGWDLLRRRWVAETGDRRPFRDWELDARREVLAEGLRPDLERVARVAADRLDADEATVEEAVAELSVHLDRYRTYLPDGEGDPALTLALAEAAASQPRLAPVLARLVTELRDSDHAEAVEWRTRWQQLTGPATAKGVEDRAFWRYVTLASLDEVGGYAEPIAGVDPVAALHEHHAVTADRWPTTLLAGTTHDTKRSEDVRANGLALAASARPFVELVDEWFDGPGARFSIDVAIQWLALQTVATTPGLDGQRLSAFLVKAGREADVHTAWTDPDEPYERQLGRLADVLLQWPPAAELRDELAGPGTATTLAMLAVRLTAPGVPDIYQGTEAFRYLLVDPDNRTPPDHDEHSPSARAVMMRRVLRVRHEVELAGYLALPADERLVAFARLDRAGDPVLVTIVPRVVERPAGLAVDLPRGEWRHVLVDDLPDVGGVLDVDEALASSPAVVLVRR
jgi:(1->4)-alpha-D-glucan 1-alpha-D-glucosylmutase